MPMGLGLELGVSQASTQVPHQGSNLLLADGVSFLLLSAGNQVDVLLLAG